MRPGYCWLSDVRAQDVDCAAFLIIAIAPIPVNLNGFATMVLQFVVAAKLVYPNLKLLPQPECGL